MAIFFTVLLAIIGGGGGGTSLLAAGGGGGDIGILLATAFGVTFFGMTLGLATAMGAAFGIGAAFGLGAEIIGAGGGGGARRACLEDTVNFLAGILATGFVMVVGFGGSGADGAGGRLLAILDLIWGTASRRMGGTTSRLMGGAMADGIAAGGGVAGLAVMTGVRIAGIVFCVPAGAIAGAFDAVAGPGRRSVNCRFAGRIFKFGINNCRPPWRLARSICSDGTGATMLPPVLPPMLPPVLP